MIVTRGRWHMVMWLGCCILRTTDENLAYSVLDGLSNE